MATTSNDPNPPDATPDVEVIEPPAVAAKAKNPPQSTPSSASPPIGLPTSFLGAAPTASAPASVAPIHNDIRPVSLLGTDGRISPVEIKEATIQPPASTTVSQVAPTVRTTASSHPPQAAATNANAASPHPLQAPAPRYGTSAYNTHPQAQLGPLPSLSQQISANPAVSLSSMAPMNPPPRYAQMAAPTPSSASHTFPPPPFPMPSDSRNFTPVRDHAAYRTSSDQFSRQEASPAPSQHAPFREPHTPSALDPYTVDNIFNGGGYHLRDAADTQLTPAAYVDQCNRLYAVFRTMHPSVVRRIVRDTWQTSIMGSEPHVSFVLNVVAHKCTGASARIAISKFGQKFVKDARWELMAQFTPAILAEMEDLVLERAPDSLLDKAMAKRLRDIPARDLLNMLARAERLGYDERDIINENSGQAHKNGQGVPGNYAPIPTAQPGLGAQQGLQTGAQPSPPPPPQGGYGDPLTCPLCQKRYASEAARNHHWKKRICQKPLMGAPYACPRCDQRFTTNGGLDYHRRNKVCGDEVANPVPAAAASPNLMTSSAGSSPASFTPTQLPSTQPQHADRGPPVSTPARPGGQGTPATSGPPPGTRVTPAHPPPHAQPTPGPKPATTPAGSQATPTYNPYAHLSHEQSVNMRRELDEAEKTYGGKMDQVRQTISDHVQQSKKLDSLKNSFATKQSMIRKKYGVRLRERRSKAAIEEERRRMGMNTTPTAHSHGPRARSPPRSSESHANKRARTSIGGRSVATQGHGVQETPTPKHAASADVAAPRSGGLAAAAAAPKTVDLTRVAGQAAGRPSVYGGTPLGPAPQPTPSKSQRPGDNLSKAPVLAVPIKMSSNTDTDSDSDDDTIPAQLPPPPPRVSQVLSKPAR